MGWDDDFSASNFNKTPAGDGAWLVRNSWSTDNGYSVYCYFWLSYYDSSLETTAYAVDASLSSSADYDNIYQHDGGIYSYPTGDSKAANIFTASASDYEEITDVVVSVTEDANVSYTIKIYTGLTSTGNPESGTLRTTQTGTFVYGGVHTVSLDNPVYLTKDTTYSIVVTLSGATKGIDAEVGGTVYSDKNSYVNIYTGIDSGESFVYENGSWVDMVKYSTSRYGNIRIKAYTKNISEDELVVDQVTDVTVTPASAVSLKISWPSVDVATGYTLYYKKSSASSWQTKTLTTTSGECIYTLTGLAKGTKYDIKIVAFAGSKTGDESDTVTMVTKPGKVAATKKSVTQTSVTLKWSKQTGATGYIIYRATSKNGTYKKIKVIRNNSTFTYKNTGLSSGKTYYYKVVAYTNYNGTIYTGAGAKVAIKTA